MLFLDIQYSVCVEQDVVQLSESYGKSVILGENRCNVVPVARASHKSVGGLSGERGGRRITVYFIVFFTCFLGGNKIHPILLGFNFSI